MRVGIVVPYDVAEEGGVKRHAFHLAESLRGLGDEVTVVCPLSRGEAGAGVQGFGGVVNVPANGAANEMALLTPPASVRRFFRERDFDLVHIHEPLVPMLAYYALLFSPRAAHVCTFHMYAERPGLLHRLLLRALAAALVHRFDRGIAVSEAAARFASLYWKRPMAVVPNGVPTQTFTPEGGARPTTPSEGAPLRLLFVGHWRDPRKGLPHLLEAYERLRARGLAVTLDVVGKGDGAPARPGVVFHGPVSSEGLLAEHYRRCDLFVAPSVGQESFGIVLLEAMACGRPVVCSDIAGYRQVVDGADARLVPPGQPAALAEAILDLARRPDARREMGVRSRTRAEEFEWERVAGRVREEYLGALADRRARLAAPQLVENTE